MTYLGARDRVLLPTVLELAGDGAHVLALDSTAIADCTAHGLEHSLLDDWVPAPDRPELFRRAYDVTHQWYAAEREALTVDGTCLPYFDTFQMIRFWHLHLLERRVGEAFVERGVERIHVIRPAAFDGALFGLPAILGAFWEWWLPEHADVRVVRLPLAGRTLGHLGGRIVRKATRLTLAARRARPRQAERRAGAFVFAASEGESYRFTELVRDVSDAGMPAAAVLSEPDWATAWDRSHRWGIPVFPAPRPGPEPEGLQLTAAMDRLATSSEGEPWHSGLVAGRAYFDHCATERWPAALAALTSWEHLWRAARPRAVVVSACPDIRPQLPAEAARRLGIPTVHLPHGALDREHGEGIANDVRTYSFEIQGQALLRTGVAPAALRRCAGTVAANEYEPTARVPAGLDASTDVLVLVNPVSSAVGQIPLAEPLVYHGEQLAALRTLADPPEVEQLRRIAFRVKPHPNQPDLELLDLVLTGAPNLTLVDPGVDLHQLLGQVRFVVALDYVGAALVHVLRLGLPTILYWNAASFHAPVPDPYPELFRGLGGVVEQPEAFWAAAAELMGDDEALAAAGRRSTAFADAMLDDRGIDGLAALLGEVGGR